VNLNFEDFNLEINNTLNFKLHKLTFTTAHLHFKAAQIVINCTLKYALQLTLIGSPLRASNKPKLNIVRCL